MSISIVACPKCGTLLLNDTAQCHRCRHVLRPDQAAKFRDVSLPSDAAVQEDLETCKQCGETYRKGLVRCWSCGAFTRPEIEEAYYRLLRGHAFSMSMAGQHHELRELSEEEARGRFWTDEEALQRFVAPARDMEVSAMDEDFELSGNFSLREASPVQATEEIPPLAPVPENRMPAASASIPPASAPSATPPVAAASIPLAKEPAAESPKPPAADAPASAAGASEEQKPPADDADSLLHIAKQQESDVEQARRARNAATSFIVYCPMGCKIRVQERHRGKMGRCPKCQTTFIVPAARQMSVSGSVPAGSAEGAASMSPAQPAASTTKYPHWLRDVHLHRVQPQKLRIKVDSLLNDFQDVDVGFDPSGILLVGYPKAGGMFGAKNSKKLEEARAAVAEHLAAKPDLEGLPAAFLQELSRDSLTNMGLSQPTPPGVESLFGDIPVFGAGRIAVRLPKFDEKTTAYLSFTLSQFREFAKQVGDVLGLRGFGSDCGVPLTDEYKTEGCHISKAAVKELQNLIYYQKDPSFKLDISGYRCKVCSAVISETARATLKLGGDKAKGIAKAKCPKCSKPMGNQPLYTVPAEETSPAEEAAAPEQAAKENPQPAPETTAAPA